MKIPKILSNCVRFRRFRRTTFRSKIEKKKKTLPNDTHLRASCGLRTFIERALYGIEAKTFINRELTKN